MRLTLLAVLVSLTLIPSLGRAETVAIPAEVMSDELVVVGVVDLSRVTPGEIDATAAALIGEDAAKLKEPLAKLKEQHEKFTKAGGKMLGFATAWGGQQGVPSMAVLVGLNANANGDDAKAMIREAAGDQTTAILDLKENWLEVVPPHSQPLGGEASDDAKKAVVAALAESGESPAVLIFTPNAGLRNQFVQMQQHMPADVAAFGGQLLDAKWIAGSVATGKAASLKIVAQSEDGDAAKGLCESTNVMLDKAREQIKAMKAQMEQQGLMQPGQVMGVTFIMGTLLEDMHATAEGTKVSIQLSTKQLAAAAKLLAGHYAGVAPIAGEGHDAAPAQGDH